MASYEKQTLQPLTVSGTGGSFYKPPEIMVCMECGAAVWPTRVPLHDTWHLKIDKLMKNIRNAAMAYTPPPPRRRGQSTP